jgi:molybdopterin-guanine dinucleotide biosynthesis protein B
MPEAVLFSVKPAPVNITAQEMPGYRGTRVQCAECGEAINFHREVKRGERILCIPCAQGRVLPNGNGFSENATIPKVLLIVGHKKVGKTTLIEKLIPELTNRGYRVGTVKHHHSDYPVAVDTAGTDTWRHRQAGALGVVLATPTDIATFRDNEDSISLDEIVATLGMTNIVLVEGFHDEARAKIEVMADRKDKPLCKIDGNLLAFVTPNGCQMTVPTFAPNDITPLADFIERNLLARA